MQLFPIRYSKTCLSRAGRVSRRARVAFLPLACELEGRTLLSTLTVVNDQVSGPGSLAGEVALARGGDTISFAASLAGHTLDLVSPLSIKGGLNLDGTTAGKLTIVDTSDVAINDNGGNLVIKDMSIVGSVHVVDGNLVVHDSTISGGHAAQGGGILVVNGNLEINHSTITGNTAIQGGGIYATGGNVEINHSIISDNTAVGTAAGTGATGGNSMGGGLYFAGFNMEINHTDFSGNMAIGGRGEATVRPVLRPRSRVSAAATAATAWEAASSSPRVT